jgi:hypothetical protein
LIALQSTTTRADSAPVTSVLPPPHPIDPGVAGRSRRAEERREIERRRLLGERRLGRRLDHEIGPVGVVLHDRIVPDGPDHLDHLVVAASGVWVVVADHHTGRIVHRRRADGDARLGIDHLDHGRALVVPARHAEIVAELLAGIGYDWADVTPVLCFTNADWGVTRRPFRIDDVLVAHGRGLVDAIVGPGALAPVDVRTIGSALSSSCPAVGAAPA